MKEGKKVLLILGGAYLHNKVVEAAREMGIYTIVADNVPDAPAKKLADKAYDINVSDVDKMVDMCRKERVDAVLTVMLDFCQVYYQQICEKLGVPCYGTEEQFRIFTNKELFKRKCIENGVDIIPTYAEADLDSDIYPILIKPAHNRGSRGQSVCADKCEAMKALGEARALSDDGHAIIEKYMGGKEDFQVTYLVIDGIPYVVRTADRYLGNKEDQMDRVAIALSSPSSNTSAYMRSAHAKVCRLFKNVGLENAPVFMQGFVDDGKFRFYDPGLRFPGGEYDRLFASTMGVNLMKLLIEFALTGSISSRELDEDTVYLKNHTIFTLHSTIQSGTISWITDKNELLNIPGVAFVSFRHCVGEKIDFTGTVNQRVAEINILADAPETLRKTVTQVENTLKVLDEEGKDMVFDKFDIQNWRACCKET